MRVGQKVLWIVIPTEEESYHLQISWETGGFLHNSVVVRSLLRRDDATSLSPQITMIHLRASGTIWFDLHFESRASSLAFSSGHSSSVTLNITVSRTNPSGRIMCLRSVPSYRSPSRSMARWLWIFRPSVLS